MGQLRDRMEADLKLGGYSSGTRRVYLLHAAAFARHFMRSPDEMGETEVRTYLLHLIEHRQLSQQTVRQARAALQFLYTTTLKRPIEVTGLPMPALKKHLPVVLSAAEIVRVLGAIASPFYRMLLACVYATGLRIGEARNVSTRMRQSGRGFTEHRSHTRGC